jgi:hypothetical protein
MKVLGMVAGAVLVYSPFANSENHSAGVYEAHDKFPERVVVWKESGKSDDECHENHHLKPDGDHDCDDKPVRGVPEPGGWASTGLLGLGVAGVYLSTRRRRA